MKRSRACDFEVFPEDSDACVIPFAQREIIDLIIDGIHPDFQYNFLERLDGLAPQSGSNGAHSRTRVERLKKEFQRYRVEHYEEPFMAAVAALPRQDLAKMAEALVSLTAFVMRMSANQRDTVSEPVDVALLSKGDGFTWIKHKNFAQAGGLA